MVTLKETALNYTGQQEITALDKVPTDLSINTSLFKDQGGIERTSYFIELNGKKYTVKAKALKVIKELLEARPTTKLIKVNKSADGSYSVIPLD